MRLVKLSLWLLLSFPFLAVGTSQYNLPVGVTDISRDVYELHMTIFYICCVIGLVVFAIMFWAIIHHRKSKGAVPAQFHRDLDR